MKIYINYNNNKKIIHTKNYQSINSILYDYLNENNLNSNIEDYYINYNGNYLDGNNSLEKYDIKNKSVLTLNIKQKGGSSFTSFAKANPGLVTIAFMISLAPLVILPTGFIPTTSSLIKTIIEKSIGSIGKYLVCNLGKVTLFSRIGFFLSFLKYVMFILMIYVLITFPLILFCVTLKGHNVLDSPQSMCGAISIGSLVGLILTAIYVMMYIGFRFGDYLIDFVIYLFKKVYFLNTTINPILISLKLNFNTFKYIPYFFIPMIGGISSMYFNFLDKFVEGLRTLLSTVSDVGCKSKFDQSAFMNMMSKRLNNFNKKTDEEKEHAEEIKTFKRVDDDICNDDFKRCCNPDNFLLIGDTVMQLLNDSLILSVIKSKGLFPAFILFNEALYEYGLSNAEISDNIPSNLNDREKFLKNILNSHKDRLSNSTKDIIEQYLKSFNPNLLSEVKTSIDTDFTNDLATINKIKIKLGILDNMMYDYSRKDGSSYILGDSLIKSILKTFVMNSFCNVLETAKTGGSVMSKMGDVIDITDMLKAGSASGITVSIGYFISIIVLLVMAYLNKF
jgi:hypothetical protein